MSSPRLQSVETQRRFNALKRGTTLLIGAVLVWGALGKVANPQEFYTVLPGYRLPLPALALQATAVILPWLELICGLLLIANLRTRAALAWAVVLFAIFAIATGQAWMRDLDIACGCVDLRLLGIEPESATARWLESAGFAFVRALVLLGFASGLFLLKGTEHHEIKQGTGQDEHHPAP